MHGAGGTTRPRQSAAVRPATCAWLCTCAEVMSVWLCFPNCVLLLCRGFPVNTRLAGAAGAPHPPPPPLKGGDWVQPWTPAPSPAGYSAVLSVWSPPELGTVGLAAGCLWASLWPDWPGPGILAGCFWGWAAGTPRRLTGLQGMSTL